MTLYLIVWQQHYDGRELEMVFRFAKTSKRSKWQASVELSSDGLALAKG